MCSAPLRGNCMIFDHVPIPPDRQLVLPPRWVVLLRKSGQLAVDAQDGKWMATDRRLGATVTQQWKRLAVVVPGHLRDLVCTPTD